MFVMSLFGVKSNVDDKVLVVDETMVGFSCATDGISVAIKIV